MRIVYLVAVAGAALTLAACESKADKVAEKQADALEQQAAGTSDEARETALNQQADKIEQDAGKKD